VTFASGASNLVSGDSNGKGDIFLADVSLSPPKITRASVSSSEAQGNGSSNVPAVAPDGHYVCFLSFASNLVSGDTNAHADMFVRDIVAGVTRVASVSSSGHLANRRQLRLRGRLGGGHLRRIQVGRDEPGPW